MKHPRRGKTPRIPIPAAVRKYVFDRDKHTCKSCGKTGKDAKLTIDHINPLAKAGTNDISNLQTLCASCNSKKKHRFDPRFQRRFDL
ncbi:MAG: HNH endonuclease [Cyanobacteria bacterium P01_A01_bin.17]